MFVAGVYCTPWPEQASTILKAFTARSRIMRQCHHCRSATLLAAGWECTVVLDLEVSSLKQTMRTLKVCLQLWSPELRHLRSL